MAWFQILLAAVFILLSFLLAPKPKREKGREYTDPENPTAEAGRPIPVLFGCMTVRGVNVIAVPDKTFRIAEVRA